MKTIPITIGERSVTFVLDSKPHTFSASHLSYEKIREVLKMLIHLQADPGSIPASEYAGQTDSLVHTLRRLANIDTFVAEVTEGRVEIGGGVIRVDGVEHPESEISRRMLLMLRERFDVRYLMRFLERLQCNPNQRVRDGLFRWLEVSNMPLTPDGAFVAYKFVRPDYTDYYTGKIDNSIGAVIPRINFDAINTDGERTCAASGYHFCGHGYGRVMNHEHVMLVKIAPEDVASFPVTEEHKGRCVFYEVVDEVKAEHKGSDRPIEQRPVAVQVGTYDSGEVAPPPGMAPSRAEEIAVAAQPTATPAEIRTKAAPRVEQSRGAGAVEWTRGKLRQLVKRLGQREASRVTGIPRSTLQGRLAAKKPPLPPFEKA